MKTINLLLLISSLAILVSCGGNPENQEQNSDDNEIAKEYGKSKVEVFYFHGDRRCAGCNAIEKVASSFINDEYPNNEDVEFFAINYDKKENNEIVEKYKISMSSLIIASGDASIDLTIEAFQNASSNPDYLKGEMKDIIDNYLE
jgi:thiol-disulfide isomerase/thioredoxin